MPLPESGPLSASQVATEFGVSQTSISFQNLGTQLDDPITEGDPVTLPDSFYGQGGSTPTVATNAASSVTTTSMTINGNVTNTGASAVTNRGFYFGTNSNYALNTKTQVGSGTGAYTLAKTGLTAGTTYYVTAYAINTQGEARGSTVSQATSGGSSTPGSVYRAGTTNSLSIANRLVMRPSSEPTTDLRLGNGSTFTVNFWVKVGWTTALNSQGRYQHLFGWAGNAVHSNYVSNVYNENFRIFFDDSMNRLYIGFLADNTSNQPKFTQNFWWFHRNGGTPNISTVTGLGTTYWTNSNRGDTNDNDFTMLTFTVNGGMTSSQIKMYWNGADVGTPYYGGTISSPTSQNNGTPANDTNIARGISLLGSPYSQNNSTYGGTFDAKAGYLGGNGTTYIDEVSIWNSVLDSEAIGNLYNEGAGGSISTTEQPEGLIAYWNFDSTSQDTNPKHSRIIWPDPDTNSGLGKMEVSGSSDFGSGTNTVDG